MRSTTFHDFAPREASATPRRLPRPALQTWGAAFGSAAGQGFSFGAPTRRPSALDWG